VILTNFFRIKQCFRLAASRSSSRRVVSVLRRFDGHRRGSIRPNNGKRARRFNPAHGHFGPNQRFGRILERPRDARG